MDYLRVFFNAWDDLESAHPFGVMYYRQLFMHFGVPEAMAEDVDEFLFLDLMSHRNVFIRRIKVQARITGEIFWVYLDLRSSTMSFQSTPAAPFAYSTTIIPEPVWLVRTISTYYGQHHRKAPPMPQRHRKVDAYLRRAQ
jgi:hypothetical protein